MILHRLIARHWKHRDDAGFYELQATDAIGWLAKNGVKIGPGVKALDLGCGHGIFGRELKARGCAVTFGDAANMLMPELKGERFEKIDLDREPIAKLGKFDLVICSNVLEHLSRPREFLAVAGDSLEDGGHFYLSWTNWLSPWGGHEFSPFHYLGPERGPKWHDCLTGRKRLHTPGVNLFPTYLGEVLGWIRQHPDLELVRAAPRYFPELWWMVRVPGVREFLTWNCALLLRKKIEV